MTFASLEPFGGTQVWNMDINTLEPLADTNDPEDPIVHILADPEAQSYSTFAISQLVMWISTQFFFSTPPTSHMSYYDMSCVPASPTVISVNTPINWSGLNEILALHPGFIRQREAAEAAIRSKVEQGDSGRIELLSDKAIRSTSDRLELLIDSEQARVAHVIYFMHHVYNLSEQPCVASNAHPAVIQAICDMAGIKFEALEHFVVQQAKYAEEFEYLSNVLTINVDLEASIKGLPPHRSMVTQNYCKDISHSPKGRTFEDDRVDKAIIAAAEGICMSRTLWQLQPDVHSLYIIAEPEVCVIKSNPDVVADVKGRVILTKRVSVHAAKSRINTPTIHLWNSLANILDSLELSSDGVYAIYVPWRQCALVNRGEQDCKWVAVYHSPVMDTHSFKYSILAALERTK